MKRMILSLFLLAIYSPSFADEVVTLSNGKKAILKDDGTWSYQVSSGQRAAELHKELRFNGSEKDETEEVYQSVSFDEIKSDIDAFNGQRVMVQSLGEMYHFIMMLKEYETDPTPLSVNVNRLSKEIRALLRAECNKGCQVTIYGRVDDVMGREKGIIADKIEW